MFFHNTWTSFVFIVVMVVTACFYTGSLELHTAMLLTRSSDVDTVTRHPAELLSPFVITRCYILNKQMCLMNAEITNWILCN